MFVFLSVRWSGTSGAFNASIGFNTFESEMELAMLLCLDRFYEALSRPRGAHYVYYTTANILILLYQQIEFSGWKKEMTFMIAG